MTTTSESSTDRAVGLAMIFVVLAVLAAGAMAATAGTIASGVAFGAAIALGAIAIVALHVY